MFELDCFMDIPACCLFSQIFQLFQWNIIGIILAAFLVMAAMSVWLLRNHWRPLYLLGIWFLFLIIMSIGSWQVYNTEHVFRETWKNTLLNMTNSFANTTERMGYAQISPEILNANDLNDSNVPNAPDDLAYQNIRNTFSRWCTEVPFVARVYTLRLRQDKTNTVTQVISSGADLNSLKNLHQHQPYNEWLEIYRKGFDGDTVLNENITSTQYGNFITAIAPLRDPEHPEFVEAVLVVDFRVDQWNPIIRQTQWISSQFLILLAALYLAVIYLIALLYRTISRFTATNQELIHAKKTTEAAAKAKNDFLANMNHDIRTPMNVIVGFTDILMHRLLKNGFVEEWEESKGILEIIQKNSQDLLTIINDFLDFSQIEANLLQIESVPLSLKQLIEDISQIEMPFIMEKKLDFSIQYKNVPELILGDPVRLRQILFNLINNAIKFTAKGKVEIRCETPLKSPAETTSATTKIKNKRQSYPESTILKISIHDTGVGISPEQMEYLFQPFAVDHSLTHEFGGTGLGLSIAKRLAQLMDGNITVKSEPNVGSVFTLILHVYLPAKQESTITTEEKHFKKSADDLTPKLHSETSEPVDNVQHEHAADYNSDFPLKNVRILLVEDMPINQMVISAQLRNAGAKVEIAGNGELGIQKITQDMDNGLFFDVVLMDMQMPVKDGYEATSQLRAQGYDCPIIAVTAHALTGDREKTIAAGCNDYISKPVDRKILINIIKKYLKQKN